MSGLVEDAVRHIEACWQGEQRRRIADTKFNLYHDFSNDPDTLSVEVVGRGNLLALLNSGYDGPSSSEMLTSVIRGTQTSLLLQDPTGQLPANGRTDDHVWADVGNQLVFQIMANRAWKANDKQRATQYQRASDLAFQNILRWRHQDGDWAGSFYITKNHFDPALRVGYQDASHVSNYMGSFLFHLSEVYNLRTLQIPEAATPSEIGGYALSLDASFDTVILDAGGLQVELNLRGQAKESSGNFWTPFGIVRIARAGWDTRLGPSDGALTVDGGLTLAPEFLENGTWLRLASLSERYRAEWQPDFVHPALVRGHIHWHPLPGMTGPVFDTALWITPDALSLRQPRPAEAKAGP